ncbi:phosphatidylserine decarboxylase [Methanococcoides orientis]|uniref:phosphatidylserine decarboxylase n=1 Tax=Methanococcoides orientis TaxID=2822137 RepID=UPI001E4016BF|nr:phosphatidylserine decarboxylase [Methanococcoides orientis]UGV40748.1 phosphatidylserine decarboxylase [Methanococcoides orientis]
MLAKDSTSWVAIVGLLALASTIVSNFTGLGLLRYLSYLCLALFIFVVWFFRDPERTTKICDHCLFSAADGKVIDISNGKVCVFMNVHNVHVNRAPISGTIRGITHIKGGHIPAFNKDSERNERTITVIESSHGDVEVTQIAGVLVRRIVSYLKVGDKVASGQKIGMIRFGSRVDVTIPSDFEISCKVGDRVYAGETMIAKEKGFKRKKQ